MAHVVLHFFLNSKAALVQPIMSGYYDPSVQEPHGNVVIGPSSWRPYPMPVTTATSVNISSLSEAEDTTKSPLG